MKVFVCIVGIVVGLALAVFGCVCVFDNYISYGWGEYEDEEIYGGDAYTGIQNAAATTANNVSSLIDLNSDGFREIFKLIGVLVFATGIGFALVSTYKLADDVGKKRKNKKALYAGNMPSTVNNGYVPAYNNVPPAPVAYQPPVVSEENNFNQL